MMTMSTEAVGTQQLPLRTFRIHTNHHQKLLLMTLYWTYIVDNIFHVLLLIVIIWRGEMHFSTQILTLNRIINTIHFLRKSLVLTSVNPNVLSYELYPLHLFAICF